MDGAGPGLFPALRWPCPGRAGPAGGPLSEGDRLARLHLLLFVLCWLNLALSPLIAART
jgi:hypothetical protein